MHDSDYVYLQKARTRYKSDLICNVYCCFCLLMFSIQLHTCVCSSYWWMIFKLLIAFKIIPLTWVSYLYPSTRRKYSFSLTEGWGKHLQSLSRTALDEAEYDGEHGHINWLRGHCMHFALWKSAYMQNVMLSVLLLDHTALVVYKCN